MMMLGDTILSTRELAKLKSALLEDIEENQPIAKDGQVAGLANLWASWQRQGIARLATWNTAKRDSATAMKAQILDDLDKWYEQSEALYWMSQCSAVLAAAKVSMRLIGAVNAVPEWRLRKSVSATSMKRSART